jgi:NAD(P)-dependent dehydrogenase (short-subunit alcohol dehydrogenase family)
MPEADRRAGRVAVVTGSGRGIGRATAARLAAEGALVVVNDIDDSAATQAAEAIRATGGQAVALVADVSSETQVDELFSRVRADHGGTDILVNNAGGASPGASWTTVQQSSLDDWNSFLALNLTAPFLCSRAAVGTMIDQGWGRIVFVSSISATNGQRAGSGYAAGKAGLTGLMASLAKEVAPHGVRVNGVLIGNAPHPTRTPERQSQLDHWVHLNRAGAYEEFAAAISFLCSQDASYLSGAMMTVDGGFSRFNQL